MKVSELLDVLRDEWYSINEDIKSLSSLKKPAGSEFVDRLKRIEERALSLRNPLLELVKQMHENFPEERDFVKSAGMRASEMLEEFCELVTKTREELSAVFTGESELEKLNEKIAALEKEAREVESELGASEAAYSKRAEEYERIRDDVEREFSTLASEVRQAFIRDVAPYAEDVEIKLAGKPVTLETLLDEYSGGAGALEISPKGRFVGKITGKASIGEIKARTELFELKLKHFSSKYEEVKKKKLEKEEKILREFSDLPSLKERCDSLRERKEEIAETLAELRKRRAEIDALLARNREMLKESATLFIRDRLLEGYERAHESIRSVLDFSAEKVEKWEFAGDDLEKKEMRSLIRELKQKLQALGDKKRELEARVEELTENLRASQFTVEEQNSRISELMENLDAMEQELTKLKERHKKLEHEHRKLENEHALAKEQIDKLLKIKEEKKLLEEEKAVLEKIRIDNEAKIEELGREIEEYVSRIKLLEGFEKENATLKTELASAKRNVERLESEVAELKDRLTTTLAEKANLEKELSRQKEEFETLVEKLNAEKVTLEAELEELRDERNELASRVKLLEKYEKEAKRSKGELLAARDRIAELEDTIKKLEAGLAELEATKKKLEEELNNTRQELSRRLEELKVTRGEKEELENLREKLEGEIQELISRIKLLESYEKENQELKQRLAVEESKVRKLEAQLETAREQITSLTAGKDKNAKELEEAKGRIKTLLEENSQMERQISRMMEKLYEFEALKGEHEKLKQKSSEQEEVLSRLRKELESLTREKEELEKLAREYHSLREEVTSKTKAMEELKEKVQKLKQYEEKCRALEKENLLLYGRVDSAVREQKERDVEIERLRRELAKLSAEMELLKNENSRLKQKLLQAGGRVEKELKELEKEIFAALEKAAKGVEACLRKYSAKQVDTAIEGASQSIKKLYTLSASVDGIEGEVERCVSFLRVAVEYLGDAKLGVGVAPGVREGKEARAEFLSQAAQLIKNATATAEKIFSRIEASAYKSAKQLEKKYSSLMEEKEKLEGEVRELKKLLEEKNRELKKKEELLERYIEQKTSALRRT